MFRSINARNVKISVFIKPEDDKDVIREGIDRLLSFLGYSDLKEKDKKNVIIEEQTASSFYDRKIEVISIKILNKELSTLFFSKLIEELDERTIKLLAKQLDSRVDKRCNLYLRFNKYIANKKFCLIDSGGCIHIKITFELFPKKREELVESLIQFLSSKFPSFKFFTSK